MSAYRWAALAFAVLALTAGGLQIGAYAATDFTRHLVLGIFGLAVGASVLTAVVRARL